MAAEIAVRVRLASGQTLKLRAATSSSYGQLVAQVLRPPTNYPQLHPTAAHSTAAQTPQAAEGAGIPAAGAQLSLNKRDPLATSPAVAVQQLGLCSGDLVFLLSDAQGYAAVATPSPRPTLVHSAAPPNRPSGMATAPPAEMAASAAERRAAGSGSSGAAASASNSASASASVTSGALLSASLARLAEMGFEPAAARAALERGGSLERAVEILSASASASAAADEPMPDVAAPPAAAPAATPSSAFAAAAGTGAPTTALVGEAPASLRLLLDSALHGSGAASAHEVVVVVLHAVLLHNGFALATTQADSPAAPALPPAWRGTPGFYSLAYTHARQPEGAAAVAELKCVAMGGALLVHAMLGGNSAPQQLLSWQLAPHEHARGGGDGQAATRRSSDLNRLGALLHEAQLRIAQPLLEQLRRSRLDPHAPGSALELGDLCSEMTLAVLGCLDAVTLCRAARVCSSMSRLATDDLLWARLCEARFGSAPTALTDGGGTTARAAFRHRLAAAREAEALRRRPRAPPPQYPDADGWRGPGWPGMPPGPEAYPGGGFGLPGVPMPGMIGGDYDLNPLGMPPSHVNPFGGGPFHGGGGPHHPAGPDAWLPHGAVPPGARFDPISPLVDPDGASGMGGMGGIGPFPGRGGRGRGGGGMGGMPFMGRGRGGGRGWDPDGPGSGGFNPHFL